MPQKLKRKSQVAETGSPHKKIVGGVNDYTLSSRSDEVLVTVNVHGKKTFFYKYFRSHESLFVGDYRLTKCVEETCPSWGIVVNNIYYVCKFHNHRADPFSAEIQVFVTMLEQFSRQYPRRSPENIFKTAVKRTNFEGYMYSLPAVFKEFMLKARETPVVYYPILYKYYAIPIDIALDPDKLTPDIIVQILKNDLYKNSSQPTVLNYKLDQPSPPTQQFQMTRCLQNPEDLQRFLIKTQSNGSKNFVIQNVIIKPHEMVVMNTPVCLERTMRSREENTTYVLKYAEPDITSSFVDFYKSIQRPSNLENQGNIGVAEPSSGMPAQESVEIISNNVQQGNAEDGSNNYVEQTSYLDNTGFLNLTGNCLISKDTVIFKSPYDTVKNMFTYSNLTHQSGSDNSSSGGIYTAENVGFNNFQQNLDVAEITTATKSSSEILNDDETQLPEYGGVVDMTLTTLNNIESLPRVDEEVPDVVRNNTMTTDGNLTEIYTKNIH